MDAIIEDGLENTEKVQEAVNNTLQLMKNLTTSTNELSAGDLSSSLDVLEKIVNVTNSTGSAIEKEVIISFNYLYNLFYKICFSFGVNGKLNKFYGSR